MDPNIENMYRFYGYIPNKTLAIVGAVVYGILMCLMFARVYFSKGHKFLYILPLTALAECIGYAVRVATTSSITLGTYVAMTFFLLLSPNALALVNYKTVGEMVRLSNVQGQRFFLKPKFVTWFFFWSDFLAFFLQASGGGLQAGKSPKMYDLGQAIALVGLGAQLIFFASFAAITYHVHKSPKYNYHVDGVHNAKQKLCYILYVTIALLYVRSIYRVAEYAGGRGGAVASAEWAFYVFDGLAIALSFVVYLFFFIGTYLPKYSHLSASSARSSADINQKTHHQENIALCSVPA
ncbi:RTA1 like protein-domain-containing protein [Choanephora cucurbitarum]|nr:RTA1 like protein-domain-containing protein [Choanephora cucurbitarum]